MHPIWAHRRDGAQRRHLLEIRQYWWVFDMDKEIYDEENVAIG
jgi:hypothetical protein